MRTCWGSCERQSIHGLENWRRESSFTRAMLLHTSLWLQWLLCVTVSFNWLITFHILLIWHHLNIFCSPTWQNPTWLGSSIWPIIICSWGLIRGSGWEFLCQRESKRCNTDGRSVWIAGETIMLKINNIWSNSTIASYSQPFLWSFQPTFVHHSIKKIVVGGLIYKHTNGQLYTHFYFFYC